MNLNNKNTLNLLQSWRESLGAFMPNSLKLLLLTTLNAYAHMWYVIISQPICILMYLCLFVETIEFLIRGNVSNFYFLCSPYIFLLACIIRSSIHLKNSRYFLNFFTTYSLIWLSTSCIIGHMFFLVFFKNSMLFIAFITYLCVVAFFMLDAEFSLKSVLLSYFFAAKMIVYNAPVFLFFMLIGWIIIKICTLFMGRLLIMYMIIALMANVLAPLFMCLINNFYIMRIHQQFNIYHEAYE